MDKQLGFYKKESKGRSMNEKIKELEKKIERLRIENKKLKERKKYGIVWEEEKEPEKVVLECKEKVPILKDVKDKEIFTDKDKPMNLLIEGDNYHALQVLNYTHKGKVDVIYIDPPYNTGNKEFMYNDKYVDKEDTYRHSKWLNFMNKRLRLAKEVLTNDGLIFISIDYNEFAQLKLLCDEIFGENNFVNSVIWKKTNSPKSQSSSLGNQHEHVLIYAKNIDKVAINKRAGALDEKYKRAFRYDDKDGRGPYQTIALSNKTTMGGFGKMKDWEWRGVKARWIYSKEKLENWWKEGKIRKTKSGYRLKDYLEEKKGKLLSDIWIDNEIKALQGGTKEYIGFATQKPLSLIKRIIRLIDKNNLVVLDFFAGSGTTAVAGMQVRKDENINLKYILCTNNEDNNGSGRKIAEDVCYPRIKQASKEYKENIKYFKTDFLDVGNVYNISDEHKIELTYKAGEMIAIREDVFEEVEKNKWWQIFKSQDKTVAIYFREDQKKLSKLFEKLKNDKAIIYLFSWGKNELKASEYGYDNIKIKDIPQPIIDVYKEINRL
jgi:adenine-specific DNA-methyltransferase